MKSQLPRLVIILGISVLLYFFGGPLKVAGYVLGGLTGFYVIVLVLGVVIRRQDSATKEQDGVDREGSEILFI